MKAIEIIEKIAAVTKWQAECPLEGLEQNQVDEIADIHVDACIIELYAEMDRTPDFDAAVRESIDGIVEGYWPDHLSLSEAWTAVAGQLK